MGGVGLFIVIILSISLRSWWGLTVLRCWGEGQFLLGPVTGTAVLCRAVRYHTGTEPHYSEPSQNTMVKHQSTCPWWYKSKPSNRGRGSCYITCMLISQVSQCFKKNWIMRNDKSLFKVDLRSCEQNLWHFDVYSEMIELHCQCFRPPWFQLNNILWGREKHDNRTLSTCVFAYEI